jgi:starch phosphorylase
LKTDPRTGLDAASIAQGVRDHLRFTLARPEFLATRNDWYVALAHAVRDRLLERWNRTVSTFAAPEVKVACYLSAEFLIGPQLGKNLLDLGIEQATREALAQLGQDLDELVLQEEEPGLGNGGLGRLAACFLDSLATLERPAFGYGIRYEFGMFDQQIRDGWQVEVTDTWLRLGNPWEIERPEVSFHVKWGGQTEHRRDESGRHRARWIPERVIRGTAFDTPIPGYGVGTCNTLRLWKAEACESLDFQAFNAGDYWAAVEEQITSETVSKVLYPNDLPELGKRLRLAQQHFLVSCSLQDLLRLYDVSGAPLDDLPDKVAIQLNDTHPALAVAELMRLLVDERLLDWDAAWSIAQRCLAYTNHTLLPEALETWPVATFRALLPRHLEIVYEINHRFLDEVRRRFPGDEARVARMSLIDEAGEKRVRMAHLACVGSHAINGVAALHSDLLARTVLRDFHELWPERFQNKTNGVTPRRFLALANPGLAGLISSAIGDGWVARLEELRKLEPLAEDAEFRRRWRAAKLANKERLASHVERTAGVRLDPGWLFDVQAKRIHEYKRQHLNALHVLHLYRRLRREPGLALPPRAVLFAGKAAPGYFMAKRIIKLVNAIGAVVNADPATNDRLRVAFVPDFNVKVGQLLYPAADLSEQISTAGKEASGTGNMKFAMNGALTIGTLDGANVEIRDEVGPQNFFLFGLNAEQVAALSRDGYRPQATLDADAELSALLEWLVSGELSRGDRDVFRPLVEDLRSRDPFLVLADYASYVACQEAVSAAWQDAERWTRMSILTTARMGRFSSDRAIREYCDDIWGVGPVPVTLDARP